MDAADLARATREPSNSERSASSFRGFRRPWAIRGRTARPAKRRCSLAPDDPRAGEQLAAVLADAGDGERLAPLADALARRFPGRPDPLFYQATALFLRGRMKEAAAAAREVVGARPDHARAQNLLGAACASQDELAARRRPSKPLSARFHACRPPYVNLGNLRLQTGDPEGAARSFAEALVTDPPQHRREKACGWRATRSQTADSATQGLQRHSTMICA